jgi:tetratricopeptide (TPR) repeat protein
MTLGPEIHDAGAAITLANGYAEARNYRRAEEVLRSALVHDPHNAALLTELARVQHLAGDNVEAERSILAALTATPESAYAMRIYASVLDGLGRRYEGLTWARRAVEAAPWDHLTHYEYARLLTMSSDAMGALPVAKEALRLAPESADVHDLLGVVLGMLGRREESTAQHQEALRLQPGHARALANIAVNHANSRRLFSALTGFRQAAQLDPHLGDEARKGITATVRMWLSVATLVAWVALWLAVQIQRNDDAVSSGARVIAGLGALIMLVMFGWLVRSMPRQLWASVLRQREYRSLQIYLGLGVVVMCVMGAFAVGAPVNIWILGGALLITVVVSWVAPRFDKD